MCVRERAVDGAAQTFEHRGACFALVCDVRVLAWTTVKLKALSETDILGKREGTPTQRMACSSPRSARWSLLTDYTCLTAWRYTAATSAASLEMAIVTAFAPRAAAAAVTPAADPPSPCLARLADGVTSRGYGYASSGAYLRRSACLCAMRPGGTARSCSISTPSALVGMLVGVVEWSVDEVVVVGAVGWRVRAVSSAMRGRCSTISW